MERLSGKQTKSLLEAYQQVYTPVITEEVLNQSAEQWVSACIQEGVNFEEYTLDEITEAFIADCEQPEVLSEVLGMPGAQNVGADLRQRFGQARRAVGGALSKVGAGVKDVAGATVQGLAGQRTTSSNPLARAGNLATRVVTAPQRAVTSLATGFLTGKGAGQRPAAPAPTGTSPTAPANNTVANKTTTPAAPAKPTGSADPRNQQYQKDRAAIGTTKTPEAKAQATKKAEATGMAAWAKANPKLAAKVKPGQAGYETIQKTLNPTPANTASAATALSGKGALSTKPAPAVGKPVAGAKPVATGTPVQGGVKPVAGAPTASAANTKFGVAKPVAAAPVAAKPAQTRAQELAAIQAKAKADTLKKSRLGEELQSEGIVDAIKKVATKVLEPANNSPEAQAARMGARRPQTETEKKVGKKTAEVLSREEFDNFDLIQAYLIDEGVTEEEALTIMTVMEDDQREEILEGLLGSGSGFLGSNAAELGAKGGHDALPWNKNTKYTTTGRLRKPGENVRGERILNPPDKNKTTSAVTSDGKPR